MRVWQHENLNKNGHQSFHSDDTWKCISKLQETRHRYYWYLNYWRNRNMKTWKIHVSVQTIFSCDFIVNFRKTPIFSVWIFCLWPNRLDIFFCIEKTQPTPENAMWYMKMYEKFARNTKSLLVFGFDTYRRRNNLKSLKSWNLDGFLVKTRFGMNISDWESNYFSYFFFIII